MTNKEIIATYVSGATNGKAHSLTIKGDTLVSYRTPIAYRESGGIAINPAYYSRITSQQTASLRRQCALAGVAVLPWIG